MDGTIPFEGSPLYNIKIYGSRSYIETWRPIGHNHIILSYADQLRCQIRKPSSNITSRKTMPTGIAKQMINQMGIMEMPPGHLSGGFGSYLDLSRS